MKRGIAFAMGAYTIWGLFPAYWKWLLPVPPLQVIAHRIVWSCVMLLVVVWGTRQWQTFRRAAFDARVLRIYLISALLIGVNWLVYVWAVNAGFVVESSLGYFINPLVSVVLGVLLLRERLRPAQWIPVALATAGVIYLTVTYGSLPWIALTLALTFGFYGLVKKIAPLHSLYGLTLETSILFVPAVFWLMYADTQSQGAFLRMNGVIDGLLIGAGLATTIPLLLFADAARRIPLSLIGILQYISPTLQFALGVLVYGEPFSPSQFIGFGLVWVALILFAGESLYAHRTQSAPVIAE